MDKAARATKAVSPPVQCHFKSDKEQKCLYEFKRDLEVFFHAIFEFKRFTRHWHACSTANKQTGW